MNLSLQHVGRWTVMTSNEIRYLSVVLFEVDLSITKNILNIERFCLFR